MTLHSMFSGQQCRWSSQHSPYTYTHTHTHITSIICMHELIHILETVHWAIQHWCWTFDRQPPDLQLHFFALFEYQSHQRVICMLILSGCLIIPLITRADSVDVWQKGCYWGISETRINREQPQSTNLSYHCAVYLLLSDLNCFLQPYWIYRRVPDSNNLKWNCINVSSTSWVSHVMERAAAELSGEILAACLACLTNFIVGALRASNQSHQSEA